MYKIQSTRPDGTTRLINWDFYTEGSALREIGHLRLDFPENDYQVVPA